MNDLESSVTPPVFESMPPRRSRSWIWWLALCAALFSLAWGVMWWQAASVPPDDFPADQLLTIPSGASLHEIATLLEGAHLIRSQAAFAILVRYRGAESRIMAGEYLFSSPLDLAGLTERLIGGERGIERVRVTVPEGTSVAGMGRLFKKTFIRFDEEQFVALTQGSEGYLFPDTYFFFLNATSGPIVETLQDNFTAKTASLRKEALANKKSWADTIIMASIVEEEAATPEDRRIVSGILWKRLAKGMHLGVDAPFAYAMGKNSATLTTDDLKDFDSPYNTYRYLGLPPTPITNPGLDAIDAVLHPETSPYYYYLSDKEGMIHYAKTFEEHKRNKEKYLR